MNRNIDEGCGAFPKTLRINWENQQTKNNSQIKLYEYLWLSVIVSVRPSIRNVCLYPSNARHYLDERRFFKWISPNGMLSLRMRIALMRGRWSGKKNKLTQVAYCFCCVFLIGFVALLLYLPLFVRLNFCMRLRCCKKISMYRASVNWFLFPVRDVRWQNGHFYVGVFYKVGSFDFSCYFGL